MVSSEKQRELDERMDRLGIAEDDLEEKFIRGSGHGGQKINKTSSTVYLKHVPTGIEIQCQEERSQALNRYRARVRLCERIEDDRRQARLKKRREQSRKRARNRKRTKGEKAAMIRDKRIRGEKKKMRGRVRGSGD